MALVVVATTDAAHCLGRARKTPRGVFFVDTRAIEDFSRRAILPIHPTSHSLDPMNFRHLLLAVALLLAACEIPGLGPDPRVAQREADGKAIGGACRHALRGLEDCFALNEKALKTAVFEGWKEMDQYMRENKIEGVAPKEVKAPPPEEEIIVSEKSAKPGVKGKAPSKAAPAN